MSGRDLDDRLVESGIDLGAMAIEWGARPERTRSIAVTGRDLKLLRFLHDFNYASTSTLAAFFWGRYSSAARERLKLLHDAGFIDKLRPAVGRTRGPAEWIYRLTTPGWRALTDWGEPADGFPFRPARLTSIAYVEHDVQVAALLAVVAGHAAEWHGRKGPLLDVAPFVVAGPRSGRIDFKGVHTPSPARSSRAPSVGASLRVGRPRCLLEPDATLTGVTTDGRTTSVLIEYDRTGRPSKQTDRLRRYDTFLNFGWRTSDHCQLDIEPAVLFVCRDPRRAAALAYVADSTLTASAGSSEPAEYVGREQIGFTSRGQVLASSDHVLQVAPQPTSGASRSAIVARRTFCLATLFISRLAERSS